MPVTFSRDFYTSASYSGADMQASITIKDIANKKTFTHVFGDLQTLSYSTHMERGAVRNLGNVNSIDFTNGPRTIAGSMVFAVFNKHMIYPLLEGLGVANKLLPDELPPFDVTVTFANEYGHNSVLRIYGIRLVNEGKVLSTNDIYIENTYQYVARDIEILKPITNQKNDDTLYQTNQQQQAPSNSEDDQASLADQDAPTVHLTPELSIIYLDDCYMQFDAKNSQPFMFLALYYSNAEKPVFYGVQSHEWPFSVQLAPGDYHAKLLDEKHVLIDEALFNVSASTLRKPYLLDVTSRMVKGRVLEDTIISVLCVDEEGVITEGRLSHQLFSFEQLKPNHTYRFAALDKYQRQSDFVTITTPSDTQELCDTFASFLEMNGLSDEATRNVIYKARELKELDFTTALTQIASESASKMNLPLFLHLSTYFYLNTRQQTSQFLFNNKWLCDISPLSSNDSFKIQSEEGVCDNLTHASGKITLKQSHEDQSETLTIFKNDANYMHTVRKAYLANVKHYASLKTIYDARYGDHLTLDALSFYDETLSSHGAYLTIIDDFNLKAFNPSSEDLYFVFKEDIAIEVAFKVRAHQTINYHTLPFYDNKKDYVVYLANKDGPVSKSIAIKQGVPYYINGSLLAHACDAKISDLIHEVSAEQMDFFESFCYAFSLLISREQLSQRYLQFFHDILYTSLTEKASAVPFEIKAHTIYFDQACYCLLFDGDGHFISRHLSDHLTLSYNTYVVWYTPDNKPDFILFDKLGKKVFMDGKYFTAYTTV